MRALSFLFIIAAVIVMLMGLIQNRADDPSAAMTCTLAFIIAAVGGLLYSWGNRAARERREDARTQAMVEALRQEKK